jgi:hypothetical protein
MPDLLTEEALATHPDELVDYLIKYRLLASKEFTDTLFKRWNTRVVAFARNKDVRVRYSACALLQLTIRHTTYERLLANMVYYSLLTMAFGFGGFLFFLHA